MSLQLRILTPNGAVVDGLEVEQLTASGLQGEFGVLEGHLPFVTALKTGPLSFFAKGDKHERYFALGEGFAEVFSNLVTLFVEVAEEAPEIDVDAAKQDLERAEQHITKLGSLAETHPDLIRYTRARDRAATRIEIASFSNLYKTY